MNHQKLPPIILLLLDSAGANRFSLYGHFRHTTPNLERMASEAAVYHYCFSNAPWTIPSHASLFTGLYPHEHQSVETLDGLPEGMMSLPEVLREQGYHTMGITNNLIMSRLTGFDRGFDKFYETTSLFQDEDFLKARGDYQTQKRKFNLKGDWNKIIFIFKYIWENKYYTFPIKKALDRLYYNYLGNVCNNTNFVTKRTMRLTKKLIKMAKNNNPFFLFINLMETHKPYSAPYPFNELFQKVDPQQRKRLSDKKIDHVQFEENLELRKERGEFWGLCQDQEVAYVDSLIWELREFLIRQQLWDRVLFIITSDHGEALGEHGVFNHHFSLYNELVHIPLIIKYPKDYQLTGDFRQLAQLNDLFATLSQVSDSPRPMPLSSYSLLDGSREFALAAFMDDTFGQRLSERMVAEGFLTEAKVHPCMLPGNAWITPDLWKLIRWQDGSRELYNLNQDFYEKHNLIDSPELAWKAADLEGQLDNYLTFEALPL